MTQTMTGPCLPWPVLREVARWKVRSRYGRQIAELTTRLGQCVRCATPQAVGTALGRSHAILKSLLILTSTLGNLLREVARWKVRSRHGREIVELMTRLGQCVRCTTLQAVGTALGRSHAILKSLLITDLNAGIAQSPGRQTRQ